MILNTKYHGSKEYKKEDILLFKKGLPGFEEYRQFILFTYEGNDNFSILHSVEEETLGFVLISPFVVDESYEFELTEEQEKELDIENADEVIVYNTVTVNSDIMKTTTNLKAPIVINIRSKLGEQLILDKEKYKLRHPLLKIDS